MTSETLAAAIGVAGLVGSVYAFSVRLLMERIEHLEEIVADIGRTAAQLGKDVARLAALSERR